MKAETLKKSILQYAMQGKLVEQNPDDEPAIELLKRIKAEKEQLIKDGKIKKEKPLPPITNDEIPFELPQGWEWVRLGNIGISNIGLTYKPTDITNTNEGIPVFRSSNIQNDKINLNDLVRVTTEIKNENLFVQSGDILICARNGSKNLVGKAAIIEKLDEPMTFGAFMAIFRSNVNNWVKIYLASPLFKKTLESVNTITINQITQSNLKNAIIPLPPLAEQQRIVEKLEQILPLIEEYGKNEEKLSELNKILPDKIKQSILQHAVQGKLVPQNPTYEPASELLKRIKAEKEQLIKDGKIKKEKPMPEIIQDEIPFEIPNSWEWVKLGELGISNIGLTYSPTDITTSANGIPVLRSSNIQNNKIDLNDLVRVTTEIKNSNLYVETGDILICARNGSKHLVGKSAIIKALDEPMTFGAFMAIFRSKVNSWIKVYLDSPLFKKTLESVNTVTINQITQSNLKNAIIPLPPLAEQQRIVTKVEELLSIVDRLK